MRGLQRSEKPRAVLKKWWGWVGAPQFLNMAESSSLGGEKGVGDSRVFPEVPKQMVRSPLVRSGINKAPVKGPLLGAELHSR